MSLQRKKWGEGKKPYAVTVLHLCAWISCIAHFCNWDRVNINYNSK